MADYFDISYQHTILHLHLKGAWTVTHADAIARELKRARLERFDGVHIERGGDASAPDTAGMYILYKYLLAGKAGEGNISFSGFTDDQTRFMTSALRLAAQAKPELVPKPKHGRIFRSVAGVGEAVTDVFRQSADMIAFFGRVCAAAGRGIISPRRLRFASIVRHIDETGIGAAPIVALLAFLISVVLSYQAATQLKPYGADIFTVDLTAISILREMGVMLTAIIVAGRSGSAFAAEIGVMRLREETDALETLGMDPYEMLVLPRVLALIFTLPLLTFLADIVGLAGGGLLSLALLDISVTQYINRLSEAVTVGTFFVGIIKAPVFALLIAIVGCRQGMSASGSADSVGRMTTTAVVRSIFLVLLADALFSILFSELGI